MKSSSPKYQFYAVLTLVLFLASFVLPVSLSAASLFCEMEMDMHGEMATMNEDVESCCGIHSGEWQHSSVMAPGGTDCKVQQICINDIPDTQKIADAIVPQLPTDIAAVAIEAFHQQVFDNSMPAAERQYNFLRPDAQPPLFLLNSTFLN